MQGRHAVEVGRWGGWPGSSPGRAATRTVPWMCSADPARPFRAALLPTWSGNRWADTLARIPR